MRLLDLTDFPENGTWTPRLVVVDNPRSDNIIEHTEYAILSHRWQPDEVLHNDVINGTAHERAGFLKLHGAAKVAHSSRSQRLWADTCCIDKTSSAELSEAINSMYYWYKRASQCIVYLHDVHHGDSNHPASGAEIVKSKWFERGWTLQELLAPHHIEFYNATWTKLGTRETLATAISQKTRIPVRMVRNPSLVNSASIAARMSWASGRKTEREEDQAYCLLGLFGVNMALLYGERSKAFIRLQEEIMKNSDDYSLFAWKKKKKRSKTDERVRREDTHSLLADSPLDFVDSGGFVAYEDWRDRTPYYMTNMGLCIELHIRKAFRTERGHGHAILPCGTATGNALMIELKWLGRDRCVRTNCSFLSSVPVEGRLTKLYFDLRGPELERTRLQAMQRIILHRPWSRRDYDLQRTHRSECLGGLIHIHPAFDSDSVSIPRTQTTIDVPSMSPGVEAAIWYRLDISFLPYTLMCCVLLGALSNGELGFAVSNDPRLRSGPPNIDPGGIHNNNIDTASLGASPEGLIRMLKSHRLYNVQKRHILRVGRGYSLHVTLTSNLDTSQSTSLLNAWRSLAGGKAEAERLVNFDIMVSVERASDQAL